MREAAFLKQNTAKWKRFEAMLEAPRTADPDRLTEGFVELTNDLAYARTFYPNSSTTAYLNALAQKVHQQIYRNRREDRGRIVRFWQTELPLLFYRHRRELAYSLGFFVVALLIGALSSAHDPYFARLIFGDAYVNMTLENIESGDPLAVYKKMHQVDMFLGITLNNVMVSFNAFVAGILLSVGTVYVLLQNGIMVGVFHYFFFERGLLGTFLLTVYIHGALELSAIVLAGGAGLVMGNSLLFPGTYPRLTAFRRGAQAGMKMVLGLVPLFIVAGFLEGFVTRYTTMPLPVSLLIIGGSFAFVIWYVVLYPARLARASAPVALNP